MIKTYDGQKTTPKRKAKEIVKRVLNIQFDILNQEKLYRDEDMTDRDWMAVQVQLHKLFDRIDPVLR